MSNYIKILFLPTLIIGFFLFIWMFVKPTYDNTSKLNQVKIPQVESLVQQENDLQQRTEKLSNEEDSGGQSDLILFALPKTTESKNLISQIEFVINKEKMFLSSITIEDQPQSDATENGILGQTGKDYQEIGGNLEVEGSYGQFKQLLADFQKLNRIVDIYGINIINTSGEGGSASGKYTLYFKAYWQPAVSFQDVRTALENQEFGGDNQPIPGIPSIPGAGLGQPPLEPSTGL